MIGEGIELAATDVVTSGLASDSGKEIIKKILHRIPQLQKVADEVKEKPGYFKATGLAIAAILPGIIDKALPGDNPNLMRAKDIAKKIGPHLSIAIGHGAANAIEYKEIIDKAVDDADAGVLPGVLTRTDGSAPLMVAWSASFMDKCYHPLIVEKITKDNGDEVEQLVPACAEYLRQKQRIGNGFIETFLTKDAAELYGLRPASCCSEAIGKIIDSHKKTKPSWFEAIGPEGRALNRAFIRANMKQNQLKSELGIDYAKELLPYMPPEHWNYLGEHIKPNRSGSLNKNDYEEVIAHIRIFAKGSLELHNRIMLWTMAGYRFANKRMKNVGTKEKWAAYIAAALIALTGISFVVLHLASIAGAAVVFIATTLITAIPTNWALLIMFLCLLLLFISQVPWKPAQDGWNFIKKIIPTDLGTTRWMDAFIKDVIAFFVVSSWFFMWIVFLEGAFFLRVSLWFIFFATWGYRHFARKSGNLSWVWGLDFGTAKTFRVLTFSNIAMVLVCAVFGWPMSPSFEVQMHKHEIPIENMDGVQTHKVDVVLIPTPEGSWFLADDIVGEGAVMAMESTAEKLVLPRGSGFDLPGYFEKEITEPGGKVSYLIARAPKIFFWEWVSPFKPEGREVSSIAEVIAQAETIDAERELVLAYSDGYKSAELHPAKRDTKTFYEDTSHSRSVQMSFGLWIGLVVLCAGLFYLLKNYVETSVFRFGGQQTVQTEKNTFFRFVIMVIFLVGSWIIFKPILFGGSKTEVVPVPSSTAVTTPVSTIPAAVIHHEVAESQWRIFQETCQRLSKDTRARTEGCPK